MSYQVIRNTANPLFGLTYEEVLEKVKRNGYTLQYVKDQTEDICLAAVNQDGHALQYVKDQTGAICLAAVQQNGQALQYVDDVFFDKMSFK